jgi:hypothetical protein
VAAARDDAASVGIVRCSSTRVRAVREARSSSSTASGMRWLMRLMYSVPAAALAAKYSAASTCVVLVSTVRPRRGRAGD